MKDRNAIHRQIKDKIAKAKTIAITTHVDPDGDAVGCVLALESFLKRYGKDVVIVVQHRVPDMYLFLGKEWIPFDASRECGHYDCVIVIDCPTKERVGNVIRLFDNSPSVINVDHHVSNSAFGDINLLDAEASSCGELLFDLLESFAVGLNEFEMSCTFVALSTDTGSFRYSNVTPRTFEIVAHFVREGVGLDALNQELYSRCPLKKFRLLQGFLGDVTIDVGSRSGWCVITQAMLDAAQAKRADAEGFIDLIRDINEVEVAIVLFEKEHGVTKVSLRSKGAIDVNRIAQRFGGGGHARAAGCTIEADPTNALARLKDVLKAGGR